MLNITAADFLDILSDQGVVVVYQSVSRVIDPIYGGETISYAANANKTWIFFKRESDIQLKSFGIVDVGDAYLMMPNTDTISYGDRVTFGGETFEFTPDCKMVQRYAAGTWIFNFCTMKKVA